MDKVTTTTVETVVKFTDDELRAILLREARMPNDSVVHWAYPDDGGIGVTIKHLCVSDDQPKPVAASEPALAPNPQYTTPPAMPRKFRPL